MRAKELGSKARNSARKQRTRRGRDKKLARDQASAGRPKQAADFGSLLSENRIGSGTTLPDLRGQSLDGLLEEDGGDPNPGRRGFAELWARCSADAPARRAEELTKQRAEELTQPSVDALSLLAANSRGGLTGKGQLAARAAPIS